MKNILKFIFISIFLLGLLPSCNEEFLENKPSDSIDAVTVFSTTKSANAAMNGVYRAMIRRYRNSQGHSGYPAFMLINDMLGDDMVLSTTSNGWHRAEQQWVSHRSESGTMPAFAYDLFYRLISNANNLLAGIDNAEGPEAERNRIKGEALGIRALSYFNLVQLFGKRYIGTQANDGLGVSLITEPTLEGKPRNTVAEIYTQINKDLAQAAALIGTSRANKSHINLNVINGLQARVALAQQKWAEAAKFAADARSGYSLMSQSQYLDGFVDLTNPEWIWGFDHLEDQSEFFGGYHSYISCNFNSSVIRTCPRAISKVLYDKIPESDVRSKVWVKSTTQAGIVTPPGGVKRAYMTQKFRLPGVPSTSTMGDVPYMRAAEMYLIEAEAKAMLGDNEGAALILFDLVKARNSDAVLSTNTGQELLDEIHFNRRIELWGEGHRWFDLKRLNLPLDRTGSNHIASNILIDFVPADDVRWEFLIPRAELDANKSAVQNPL